jgi:actin-related protein
MLANYCVLRVALIEYPLICYLQPGTEGSFGSTFTQQQIDASLGIHQLIFNSICSCDIDLRPLLFNNVVVTGGNSLYPGFVERLNYELPGLAPGVSTEDSFIIIS